MGSIHLSKADFATKSAPVLGASPDQIAKAGSRKSKADQQCIQEIHDKAASLVDKMHCAAQSFSAEGQKDDAEKQAAARALLEKVGKRHSAADMAKIKEAHDAMCALGAKCDVAEPEEGAEPGKDGEKEDGKKSKKEEAKKDD